MIAFILVVYVMIMWFAIFDASPFIALAIAFGIGFCISKIIKAIKKKKKGN